MDVKYFLTKRLTFLRQLHLNAIAPYLERKRKIEAQEEPFVPQYFDDSGEPAYLDEWLETDESIQVLGRACASMLAATLKVYLETWRGIVGAPTDAEIDAAFKKNWLAGYKAYFERHATVSFVRCPVDLQLLEELVLVRNRVQHPESLVLESPQYSQSDLRKLNHPFFIDDSDVDLSSKAAAEPNGWFLLPTIRITPEKFEASVQAVERFAEWLESQDGDDA